MGGLDRVWISVGNLERSLEFYRDYVGLTLVRQGQLDPREARGLAGQAGCTEARVALLTNQVQSTRIALVEFKPGSSVISREGAENWDFGLWDIAFMVGDAEPTHQDLMARGFHIVLKPLVYAPFGNAVTILAVKDADGVMLGLIEKTWDGNRPRQRFYGMADVGQIADNLDEVKDFYCGILGLDFISRTDQAAGALDKAYGLPEGSKTAILLASDKKSTAVYSEFIQFSVKGKPIAARPPGRGMFMVSYQVVSLSGVIKECARQGYRILMGPQEYPDLERGKQGAAVIEGPGSVMVQAFEI